MAATLEAAAPMAATLEAAALEAATLEAAALEAATLMVVVPMVMILLKSMSLQSHQPPLPIWTIYPKRVTVIPFRYFYGYSAVYLLQVSSH